MGDSPFLQFVSTLTPDSVWVAVKIVFLIAFLIYALFALVILAQVNQMKKSLVLGLEYVVLPVVWVHLLVAVMAFILAFVLL